MARLNTFIRHQVVHQNIWHIHTKLPATTFRVAYQIMNFRPIHLAMTSIKASKCKYKNCSTETPIQQRNWAKIRFSEI